MTSALPRVLQCPYCKGTATLQPGDRVWPGKGHPSLYVCENYPACDAYVRCHQGTTQPLGTLARKRLRGLRKLAHDKFDPLWQDSSNDLGRTVAYEAAAAAMGIEGEFHIGDLDEKGCEQFIERMTIVEMEIDERLKAHYERGAPPSEVTQEILHTLFHPDRETFLPFIPLDRIALYAKEWSEAQRCGLVQQAGYKVTLTPKGRALLFDPTT